MAALAPGTAEAFCRRTTCPSCPVDPLTRCPTGEQPVAWPSRCVSYSLARGGSAVSPSEATSVAAAAFRTWQSVTCPGTSEPPSIVVSDAFGFTDCAESSYDPAGSNVNSIFFRAGDGQPEAPADAVAFTTTHFDEATGDIVDADVEIDGSLPIATSDAVPKKSYDLLSILTHEAGHFLGLAHSYEPGATMQPSVRPGTTDHRALGADDVAGICAIYPPNRASMPCDFNPQGGFAAECGVVEARGGCSVTAFRRRSTGDALLPFLALCLVLGRFRGRGRYVQVDVELRPVQMFPVTELDALDLLPRADCAIPRVALRSPAARFLR